MSNNIDINSQLQKKGHFIWIDILKGIAIILVVIAHNTIGTNYRGVSTFIYTLHMPLFLYNILALVCKVRRKTGATCNGNQSEVILMVPHVR